MESCFINLAAGQRNKLPAFKCEAISTSVQWYSISANLELTSGSFEAGEAELAVYHYRCDNTNNIRVGRPQYAKTHQPLTRWKMGNTTDATRTVVTYVHPKVSWDRYSTHSLVPSEFVHLAECGCEKSVYSMLTHASTSSKLANKISTPCVKEDTRILISAA